MKPSVKTLGEILDAPSQYVIPVFQRNYRWEMQQWEKFWRILRHAKSHVTKQRYIKAFDPAVLAAMRKLKTSLDAISQGAPIVHQIN